MSDDLRERLADLAHQQWSGWMHYLFSKCSPGREPGSLEIPAWAVERWSRQCATPYSNLPPDEQESDRKEADKFLAVTRDKAEADCQGAAAFISDLEYEIRSLTALAARLLAYIDEANRNGRTCIPVLEDDASQVEEAVLAVERGKFGKETR